MKIWKKTYVLLSYGSRCSDWSIDPHRLDRCSFSSTVGLLSFPSPSFGWHKRLPELYTTGRGWRRLQQQPGTLARWGWDWSKSGAYSPRELEDAGRWRHQLRLERKLGPRTGDRILKKWGFLAFRSSRRKEPLLDSGSENWGAQSPKNP